MASDSDAYSISQQCENFRWASLLHVQHFPHKGRGEGGGGGVGGGGGGGGKVGVGGVGGGVGISGSMTRLAGCEHGGNAGLCGTRMLLPLGGGGGGGGDVIMFPQSWQVVTSSIMIMVLKCCLLLLAWNSNCHGPCRWNHTEDQCFNSLLQMCITYVAEA